MLTTDDIRHGYGKTPPGHAVMKVYDKNVADFDQWLAEHDRQVAEAAWGEGFLLATRNSPTQPHPMLGQNPHRKESE